MDADSFSSDFARISQDGPECSTSDEDDANDGGQDKEHSSEAPPPPAPAPPLDISYRFAYSAQKAGMGATQTARIADTIRIMSTNSAYYQNEARKSAATDSKVARLREQVQSLSPADLAVAQAGADKKIREWEAQRDLTRCIVHVDMDAFYCAVAELDDPSLVGKPVGVGGMSMLSTANYAARKFGVRAAMPGYMAKALCPDLILVPSRFDRYREISQVVRAVLIQYDPTMQPVGLDESYLDLTDYLAARGLTDPRPVVEELRHGIFLVTKLTASAGIACNKMLAKIGSDINKPNGQHWLAPTREAVSAFMRDLPARKICGVGKVTEHMLEGLGIRTCNQVAENAGLLALTLSEKGFDFVVRAALGHGSTRVAPATGLPKSVSTERTFRATTNSGTWADILEGLVQDLANDLAKHGYTARHLSVKAKTAEFVVRQSGSVLPRYLHGANDLLPFAITQFRAVIESLTASAPGGVDAAPPLPPPPAVRLRLIGVRAGDIAELSELEVRGLRKFFSPATADAVPGPALAPASSSSSEQVIVVPTASAIACPICSRSISADPSDDRAINAHIDDSNTRTQLSVQEK
ncbi:hypothetical protein BC828DRAFT_401674 [Blastocladiella britannica]|nr:hypothetical protein BC828DRAFT_401674 [Blastocladiella britannica]